MKPPIFALIDVLFRWRLALEMRECGRVLAKTGRIRDGLILVGRADNAVGWWRSMWEATP